jgi:hypothetical protein
VPQRYSVVHTISALAAARDLIEIATPATGIVRLVAAYVSQDSDDATSESEMLPIIWQRATVSGSGGSTLTPEKLEQLQAAASSTVEGGNTVAATLTGAALHRDSFNVLSGFAWEPLKAGIEIIIKPSGFHVLRLDAAPTDAIDLKVTVFFEEIG